MKRELHKTSRAFLSVYRKGRKACEEGKTRRDCPYPDHRGGKFGQIVTWSRAFRTYWLDGFDDVLTASPERYTA